MSLEVSRWVCDSYSLADAERLARELDVSRTLAAILVRRGYTGVEAAETFLAAGERHDPELLAGIEHACGLVLAHVGRGSRIVVHGDYDVDGVCATAILLRALRELGAEPAWHLPSRFDEGYGLAPATIERLAADGTGLLITADCGITAAAEVEQAQAAGIDVLVTDHHRPGERLPPCPIVHPALGDYPFEELCAAAVALKLSEALLRAAGRDPALAERDADLAGLATVCDMVPLRGENRRLAREGIAALARTAKPGLRALMRVASLDPGAGAVDERAAGFRLGPRLNAAGRMKRADAALELLLTEDEARAEVVADELDLLNRDRREQETRALFAAEARCAPQASRAVHVVAGEGWNPGVVGIVASRLVERHHRPCVVIALDGDGGGTGSGRSIPAYDLHAGLSACSGRLRRFGGHRAAAGLELDEAEVEPFARELARHAAAALRPDDLTPLERVDAVVGIGALGLAGADELERLRPFGAGNPEPTLLAPAAKVDDVRPMGEERQHARFTIAGGGARARGVAFRTSPRSLSALEEPSDLALRLERNVWNGTVEPRVVLRALCRPSAAGCPSLDEDSSFWDALSAELDADPEQWCEAPGRIVRERVDRRREGIAAVAGELVSSGAATLLVCADVSRRRGGLGRLAAVVAGAVERGDDSSEDVASARPGASARPDVALASWDALARDPALGERFDALVAVDPPPLPVGVELLCAVPAGPSGGTRSGTGTAQLAWGAPEADFALAVARSQLELHDALAGVYRALRTLAGTGDTRSGTGGSPDAIEAALRGTGAHPRTPEVCGRLVRVLTELGLLEFDLAGRSCTVLEAERTALERSPAYRGYRARLARVAAHLVAEGAQPAREVPAAAAAG